MRSLHCSRYRRCHPRAPGAVSGRRARICAGCAVGASRVDACDSEVHRREILRGGGRDQAGSGRDPGWRDRDFISRLRIFPNLPKRLVFSGLALQPARSWPPLAKSVDEATAALGVPKEEHEFSPHLTLARRSGSGVPHWRKGDRENPAFQRLQEKLAAMPALEFGTMTAREFFLYQSQLMRGGAYRRCLK